MPEAIQIDRDLMYSLVPPGGTLQKLASDVAVHSEGPAYFPADDSLIWSDAHGDRLLRWHHQDGVSIIRQPSSYQNGNCRDLEGRLVGCSSGNRSIVRREHNGEWITLVDRYQYKRLNSPNDLAIKRDGTIWFTDPPYGLTQPHQGYGGRQEQAGSCVYRFDPATQEIDAVITDMERPNGIAFSPDESLLYISDTSGFDEPQGYHHIRAYSVVNGRQVTNGRILAVVSPGQPDGLCVDASGHVFSSSQDSVQVFTPDGTRLGKILIPETCTNLTFGGHEDRRLFITAGKSLYAIDLNTRGIQQ
jgi:gluconolactonase